MAANGNFLSVDIAEFVHCINGGASIGYQLFNKGIVGFFIAFANNRKGFIVEYHIPFGYPIHKRSVVRESKLIGVFARLPRTLFVFKLLRVSPDKQREL